MRSQAQSEQEHTMFGFSAFVITSESRSARLTKRKMRLCVSILFVVVGSSDLYHMDGLLYFC